MKLIALLFIFGTMLIACNAGNRSNNDISSGESSVIPPPYHCIPPVTQR